MRLGAGLPRGCSISISPSKKKGKFQRECSKEVMWQGVYGGVTGQRGHVGKRKGAKKVLGASDKSETKKKPGTGEKKSPLWGGWGYGKKLLSVKSLAGTDEQEKTLPTR